MSQRSRKWCFTLNNYTPLDEKDIEDSEATYACFGREVGANGTPHLQGFAVFRNARRLSTLKFLLPRAHWEIARGSIQQNIDYCSKDGNFVEFGQRPLSNQEKGNQERERWIAARTSAQAGRLDEIDADIYIRYYSALKRIKKDHMAPVSDAQDVTGVWIWGEAGVGKSRKARQDYPGAYLKMCNKWWDGYQDEKYVIIDDVDPKHACLAHHFKIWADRYCFLAEVKGGAIKIRPEKIIVTSQYSPEGIWPDEETRSAIRRRFIILHMTNLQ